MRKRTILDRDREEAVERQAAWELEQALAHSQRTAQTLTLQVGNIEARLASLEEEAAPLRERYADVLRRADLLVDPRTTNSCTVAAEQHYARQLDQLRQETADILLAASQFRGGGVAAQMSRYYAHRGLQFIEAQIAEAERELELHRPRLAAAKRELKALEKQAS